MPDELRRTRCGRWRSCSSAASRTAGRSIAAHYGCPVQFATGEDSFTLTRGDADKQLPSSNRQIATTLDAILAQQLAQLDKSNVVARCRASLLEQLSSGELSEEEMAQQLHMSRRTLQRKLADAETTYQQLVDETRRELALRYIENPHHSITDITFMLGFSQQSAFTRAFRRWTGAAPASIACAAPPRRAEPSFPLVAQPARCGVLRNGSRGRCRRALLSPCASSTAMARPHRGWRPRPSNWRSR